MTKIWVDGYLIDTERGLYTSGPPAKERTDWLRVTLQFIYRLLTEVFHPYG